MKTIASPYFLWGKFLQRVLLNAWDYLINTYTNFVYLATDFTKTMLIMVQLASS